MTDPFSEAMTHYNPNNCLHPFHAGDLPPLFGSRGYAFSVFLSDRFSLSDVLGKTVIIHGNPDDFTTQPSGNAGEKLACGVVKSCNLQC
jgi:Cu-Zn family superoxide dismutase